MYKPINKVFLLYSCCRDKYGICIQYFWYASYSAFKFVLCLNVSWYGAFVCDLDTINQLLFTATLFHKVLEIIMKIHWFWVTIFCNQDVYYLENNRDNQFAVKNIRNDEALTNLIKISRSWIKVGLQWLNWTSFFFTTNCNFLSLYDRARKNKFKNWCWIFSTKKFSQ